MKKMMLEEGDLQMNTHHRSLWSSSRGTFEIEVKHSLQIIKIHESSAAVPMGMPCSKAAMLAFSLVKAIRHAGLESIVGETGMFVD